MGGSGANDPVEVVGLLKPLADHASESRQGGHELARAHSCAGFSVVPYEGDEQFTEEELFQHFIALRRAERHRIQQEAQKHEQRRAPALMDAPQVPPDRATTESKPKAKGKGKVKAKAKAKMPNPNSWQALGQCIDNAQALNVKKARATAFESGPKPGPIGNGSSLGMSSRAATEASLQNCLTAEGSVRAGCLPDLMSLIRSELTFKDRMQVLQALIKSEIPRLSRFQELGGIEVLRDWLQVAADTDKPAIGLVDNAAAELSAIISVLGRMRVTLHQARELKVVEACAHIREDRKQVKQLALRLVGTWQAAAGIQTLDDARHSQMPRTPVSSPRSPASSSSDSSPSPSASMHVPDVSAGFQGSRVDQAMGYHDRNELHKELLKLASHLEANAAATDVKAPPEKAPRDVKEPPEKRQKFATSVGNAHVAKAVELPPQRKQAAMAPQANTLNPLIARVPGNRPAVTAGASHISSVAKPPVAQRPAFSPPAASKASSEQKPTELHSRHEVDEIPPKALSEEDLERLWGLADADSNADNDVPLPFDLDTVEISQWDGYCPDPSLADESKNSSSSSDSGESSDADEPHEMDQDTTERLALQQLLQGQQDDSDESSSDVSI